MSEWQLRAWQDVASWIAKAGHLAMLCSCSPMQSLDYNHLWSCSSCRVDARHGSTVFANLACRHGSRSGRKQTWTTSTPSSRMFPDKEGRTPWMQRVSSMESRELVAGGRVMLMWESTSSTMLLGPQHNAQLQHPLVGWLVDVAAGTAPTGNMSHFSTAKLLACRDLWHACISCKQRCCSLHLPGEERIESFHCSQQVRRCGLKCHTVVVYVNTK